MYKISIQYTNLFNSYRMETIYVTYGTDRTGRTDSGDTICPPMKMAWGRGGGGIKSNSKMAVNYAEIGRVGKVEASFWQDPFILFIYFIFFFFFIVQIF